MCALTIDPVSTKRDLDAFLDLPLRLYQGDTDYVAPLRPWLRRRLSLRNPFFREAGLKLFVARRGGEVAGTISVLRDRRHERHQKEKVAFFGFFEASRSHGVAEALLETATDQASAWGVELLRGPRNLTRVEETGTLVEGHGRPPMLAGHQPLWYGELLESEGFTKHHDVLAYETPVVDEQGNLRTLPEKLARKAAAVDIPGLEVRSVHWSRARRDLALAHEVFVEAFRNMPENTPMPRAQFVNLGGALLMLSNRHMLQLALVDGQAAGFALCFPELNEAAQRARGRLDPVGLWRFITGLRQIETASFKLLGVLPAYRGTGLHALLIHHVIEGVKRAGYRRLEASLIDERNGPMRNIVESAGMTPYRRYRVYERPV
jgi:GNAT superfamily N-acetyltransferase